MGETPASDPKHQIEYSRLNVAGRAVYTVGAVAGLAARIIQRTSTKVRALASDAKQAFNEGLDSSQPPSAPGS